MKALLMVICLLAAPTSLMAATINLRAGESATLRPGQETTVTCAMPAGTAPPPAPATTTTSVATTPTPGARTLKCASPASEDACRGLNSGDLCRRDDRKGTCVGQNSVVGFECRCLVD